MSCSAKGSRTCGSSDARLSSGFYSADHWLDLFRTYFGPIKIAFERVGPEGEEALEADLRALLERFNIAGDRALVSRPTTSR